MMTSRRAVTHVISAARELEKAMKSVNSEIAELHLLEAVKHTALACNDIMPIEGGGNES